MAFSAEEEAQLRALLNSGKTIKAMHEDDPTAADTTGAEFYFATLKDDGVALSNAGAKSQQAADILATKGVIAENFVTLDETVVRADDHDLRLASIESQFPLPDPDPDPAPTPVFVATIDDDKLFANILIINSTGTHIAITSDDLSIPQNPLLNPGAWEEGIPSSYNMVDWTAKDLRCYQWDVDAGVNQILPQGDDAFITVTPNDTLGPTDLSISAVGAVVTLVAATDAGIGLATNPYKLYVDGALFLDNIGQAELVHTIDMPAGSYSVYYTAQDVTGNSTDSDAITVTIAAGGIGTVGFTDILHEFTENAAGTYLVELSTPGTGGYDVDVSIIEQTAVDTTTDAALGQFARKVGETISIGAAATYDVTITLDNDSGVADINQAFMVIDFDQAALGGALVSSPSTRLLITGSGATGDSGWQMEDVSPYALTIEAEDWAQGGAIRNSIASGQTSDAFSEAGWGLRDLGNHMTAQTSANDYGSNTVLSTEAPYIQYQLAISSAAVAANGATDLFDLFTRCIKNPTAGTFHCSLVRTVASISVDGAGLATVTLDKNHGGFAGTETIYFEDLEGADSAEYNVVAGLTPNAAAAGATFTISGMTASGVITSETGNLLGADINLIGCDDSPYTTPNSNAEWEWSLLDGVTQASMFIDEAGTWDFRIYMQSNTHRVDRFSILARAAGANGSTAAVNVTDAGTKENSQDDDMGLVASIYATGSGDPVEDEDNLPNLFVPLPTATVSLTNDHVNPDFGQEEVAVTTKVVIDLTGMSELEINDFRMLEPNLSRRADTSYTVNGMVATLDPGFMTEGIFYTVEIDARVRDTDGVVKTIAFTTDPWRFKTVVSGGSGTSLFEQDFSSTTPLASGSVRNISLSEAITLFDSTYIPGSSAAATFTSGRAQLVGDPFNEGNGRGNVLQFNQYQGAIRWFGNCNFMTPPGFGAYDELWFSFDIGLPANFSCNSQNHMVVLRTSSFNPVGNPQGSGELACFMDLHGNNSNITGPTLGKIDNHIVPYFYHQTCNQRWWFSRFDQPNFNSIACEPCCQNPKPGAVYAGLQKGRFHHLLMHVKKNTTGTTDATANGIFEFFMDGRAIVQKTNVPWVNPASPGDWESVGFDHWSSDADPIHQDQVIYYDRLRVSNTEIT